MDNDFDRNKRADRLRVYYLGSGDIAAPTGQRLAAGPEIDLVGCGTQPDRPKGRKRRLKPTPVGAAMESLAETVDKPASVNAQAFLERLAALRPDLILVFAFGQILSEPLLNLPPLGCVNIHASLLPRYRGAAPVNATLAAGDSKTGISIMKMTRGLDTGPVYKQFELELRGDETAQELSDRLAQLASLHICDVLLQLAAGELHPVPQDDSRASLAPKLSKADGRIDWQQSAVAAERHVRAHTPWPGAWFTIGPECQTSGLQKARKRAKKIIVTRAAVQPATPEATPGTVLQADKHGWSIACRDNALEILNCIPEGKREMTGTDFIRGFPILSGTFLDEKDVCKRRESADADSLNR